jgi:hypothetical protein
LRHYDEVTLSDHLRIAQFHRTEVFARVSPRRVFTTDY